jgi:hypothetical protein
MEDSEHRALWGALGVALLIAGVVTLSDWTFTAVAAPPSRALTTLWWPWAFALVLMGCGIYFLVAVSNEKIPLPGRNRQRIRTLTREAAQAWLSRYHARGARMALEPTTTPDQYEAWRDSLADFVEDAWGLDQSMALNPPNRVTSPNAAFQEVTNLLTRLIERCRIIPVREDFDPLPASTWRAYWEVALTQDE